MITISNRVALTILVTRFVHISAASSFIRGGHVNTGAAVDLVGDEDILQTFANAPDGYSRKQEEDADFEESYKDLIDSLATMDESDPVAGQVSTLGIAVQTPTLDDAEDDTTSETFSKKRARTNEDGASHVPALELTDSSEGTDTGSDGPKSTTSTDSLDSLISDGRHRISWTPFVRRGVFSRSVSQRTREACLGALLRELRVESRLGTSAALRSPHEIIIAVIEAITTSRSDGDMSEVIPRDGLLVEFRPREDLDRLDLEANDIIQYAFFKRRMSALVHEELVRVARERQITSAEEILESLDIKYPHLAIADRFSVEDIVDWYNNAASVVAYDRDEVIRVEQNLPEGVEPFDEYVEMSLPLFIKTVKRLIDLADSDTRLNAGIQLPPPVRLGRDMYPVELLAVWNTRNGRAYSKKVKLSSAIDSLDSFVDEDEKEELLREYPEYVLEIMREWRETDPPRDTEWVNPVPEKLRNKLYPINFSRELEGDRDKFLRCLLRAGVGGFPFSESVFALDPSISTKRAKSFYSFLKPIQRLAVIDEEVYRTIKMLYVGVGQALATHKKLVEGGQRLRKPIFTKAEEVVEYFHGINRDKYGYLTIDQVSIWARFVVQYRPGRYDFEWIRKYVIPTEDSRGNANGERKLVFMETHFFEIVEQHLFDDH